MNINEIDYEIARLQQQKNNLETKENYDRLENNPRYDHRYTRGAIASLFGISTATVKNRIEDLGDTNLVIFDGYMYLHDLNKMVGVRDFKYIYSRCSIKNIFSIDVLNENSMKHHGINAVSFFGVGEAYWLPNKVSC